ncbi:MAG: hypothetical protein ACK535_04705 [Cyanobacteriota bacterium]
MPPTPTATYERLREYIDKRMRMSHIDQPLMLMVLLGEDVIQIDDYTDRVKRMVAKVLSGNGITRYDQGADDLVGGGAEGFCEALELSDAERDQLLQLCRQSLDAFREQLGEEVGCLLIPKPAA